MNNSNGSDDRVARVKVALVTSAHPADDVRITLREAKSLSRLYDVTVYALQGESAHRSEHLNVRVLAPPPGGRVGRMVLGPWKVLSRAIRDGAQVIHMHDIELVVPGLLAASLFGRIAIYDVHEDFVKVVANRPWIPGFIKPFVRTWVRAVNALSRWFCPGIVVTTIDYMTPFCRRRRIPPVVVRNVPDISRFAGLLPPAERVPEYDVVHLGTISVKRAPIIASICKLVIDLRPGTRFLFVGPPALAAAVLRDELLPEYDACISILDRVRPEAVPGLLTTARVGLNWTPDTPQFRGGIPTKLLEYMAAGLVSITTPVEQLQADVPPAETESHGVLIAPREIGGYARCLVDLLEADKEAGDRLACAASQWVRARLSWDTEVQKLLALYSDLLGASAPNGTARHRAAADSSRRRHVLVQGSRGQHE